MDVKAIIEMIDMMCEDTTISRSVRETLNEIKNDLQKSNGEELSIKIDSAIQKIESISLDPNISPYVRTQIWNLASMLESALQ